MRLPRDYDEARDISTEGRSMIAQASMLWDDLSPTQQGALLGARMVTRRWFNGDANRGRRCLYRYDSREPTREALRVRGLAFYRAGSMLLTPMGEFVRMTAKGEQELAA